MIGKMILKYFQKKKGLFPMEVNGVSGDVYLIHIISNFKNPLVSREQLNNKQGATNVSRNTQ